MRYAEDSRDPLQKDWDKLVRASYFTLFFSILIFAVGFFIFFYLKEENKVTVKVKACDRLFQEEFLIRECEMQELLFDQEGLHKFDHLGIPYDKSKV